MIDIHTANSWIYLDPEQNESHDREAIYLYDLEVDLRMILLDGHQEYGYHLIKVRCTKASSMMLNLEL